MKMSDTKRAAIYGAAGGLGAVMSMMVWNWYSEPEQAKWCRNWQPFAIKADHPNWMAEQMRMLNETTPEICGLYLAQLASHGARRQP